MAKFAPAPTFVEPVNFDASLKPGEQGYAEFNSAWTNWFLELVSYLNGVGGIENVVHNNTNNLQGGTTGEYYHLTLAQYLKVSNSGFLTSYTKSIADGISLSSGVATTIGGVNLTAGSWNVTGVVRFDPSGATCTNLIAGSSSINATFDALGTYVISPYSCTGASTFAIPTYRFAVTSDVATIFLIGQATYSGGTVKASGYIRAEQVL
jgi:hypothetical protein